MRFVAVLALLAMPTSQALAVAVDGPQEALRPGEEYPVLLTVTVDCVALLVHPELEPRLEVTTEAGPFVVTGPADAMVDRQACVGKQESEMLLDFTVAATMETPPETPLSIRFDTVLAESEEAASTEMEVEAAYVGTFAVTVLSDHKEAGPQKHIPFEIEIHNQANARTVFSFSTELAPQGQLVLPDPLILDGAGGMDRDVVTVAYMTPYENGANDVSDPLQITIHAASLKGSPGNSATLDLQADTKGFYVPGPGTAVVGMVLLALAKRR